MNSHHSLLFLRTQEFCLVCFVLHHMLCCRLDVCTECLKVILPSNPSKNKCMIPDRDKGRVEDILDEENRYVWTVGAEKKGTPVFVHFSATVSSSAERGIMCDKILGPDTLNVDMGDFV